MDAFTPYLAVIHRQELLDQAENERLASAARHHRAVPAWRRSLGSLFASAASTLDPSIDTTTTRRAPSGGSSARAIA